MVELIVVMLVLSILAAYISLRTPSKTSFELNDVIENFKQDLLFTKTLSMSLNQRYQMVASSNSYQIQNQASAPFTMPSTGADSISLPSGITLTTPSTIQFNALGQPLDVTSVAITTAQNFTFSDGSTSRTIIVEPQTGFIHE